ncbi:SCO6745 family protein [Longispora urticae]
MIARRLWTLFEPLHAVTYFAPECRAAFEEAGLRGFWRGYFGGRAAPLGPVGAAPVTALFFGFAPRMVERALPAVWELAGPEEALRARAAGARAALARLFGSVGTGPGDLADPAGVSRAVAEAAGLLRRAAEAVDTSGRPLAAANAALAWPTDRIDVVWHAATVLREHRGDGHVAALVVAGLDGCESLAWRAALDNDRTVLQPARGWSDEEWGRAEERLREKGWVDADGKPTEFGEAAFAQVEARTDVIAEDVWRGVDVARLVEVLEPLARAAADALPFPNPIGLTK